VNDCLTFNVRYSDCNLCINLKIWCTKFLF
jgi:hypothetical protein